MSDGRKKCAVGYLSIGHENCHGVTTAVALATKENYSVDGAMRIGTTQAAINR
jgi:hypothetical protein